MNCENFENIIGMRCSPIGDAVEVITPFAFADGGGLEVFAQARGPQVHFFDDGFTLVHLNSIGIEIGANKKRWIPLKNIAETYGVSLSDKGVFETLASTENASLGFARMISTLLGVDSWARTQIGVSQDAAWLVEEVALYLRAWKPQAGLIEKPSAIKSRSGRALKFDFQFEKQYIDAIQPHGISTGSELSKIVDAPEDVNIMVIVDDRTNPEKAKQEMEIIGRVGTAWSMSSLVSASGAIGVMQ